MLTETPLQRAERMLGRYKIAALCECSYSAVQQWSKNGVPAKHVLKIEEATGGLVTRHELRPDVFGEPPKAPKQRREQRHAA